MLYRPSKQSLPSFSTEWEVVVRGPADVQLLTQSNATFSVGLCVTGECQTVETHILVRTQEIPAMLLAAGLVFYVPGLILLMTRKGFPRVKSTLVEIKRTNIPLLSSGYLFLQSTAF